MLALTLALLSGPPVVTARGGEVATIGVLLERSLEPPIVDGFRRDLADRGWVEGLNLRIEHRSADGNFERLPELVADLIRLRVALIVTAPGTPAALAAKKATVSIPIVFVTGGDPVDYGIVSNLARWQHHGIRGGVTATQKRLLLREIARGGRSCAEGGTGGVCHRWAQAWGSWARWARPPRSGSRLSQGRRLTRKCLPLGLGAWRRLSPAAPPWLEGSRVLGSRFPRARAGGDRRRDGSGRSSADRTVERGEERQRRVNRPTGGHGIGRARMSGSR
jgi:hypothetical protein